jgi:hypothetical protein
MEDTNITLRILVNGTIATSITLDIAVSGFMAMAITDTGWSDIVTVTVNLEIVIVQIYL